MGSAEDTTVLATYNVVLPILCSIGVLGNVLSVWVLGRKRFRTNMFVFLRGLAWADLSYLVFTIQFVAFVDGDLARQVEPYKTAKSRDAVNYKYNVLPALMGAFGSTSHSGPADHSYA